MAEPEKVDARIEITEEEWKKRLTPEEYKVLREKGTEPAFSGEYYKTNDKGMYVCRACGNELFSSETKYESGTGWPSFFKPVSDRSIHMAPDFSHGMDRTEVVCNKCGSHLGHVFPDGPEHLSDGREATGQRFCMNSTSLKFKEDGPPVSN